MTAAAVAGLVLGLVFIVITLLCAILACAKGSEVESLPLHNVQSTSSAPAQKEAKSAQSQDNAVKADVKDKTQQDMQQKKDAKDMEDKHPTKKPGECSGSKLWQEYVARAGTDTGKPQYLVFDPKTASIDLKPAPVINAPFLKIDYDGKVELVDGGNEGGGEKQKQAQQEGAGKKKEEKKQGAEEKGKERAKKDNETKIQEPAAETRANEDEANDSVKDDGRAKNKNESKDKANKDGKGNASKPKVDFNKEQASTAKAEDKKPDTHATEKEASTSKLSTASLTAKKVRKSDEASKLSLHGTVELIEVLKALGVTVAPSTSASPFPSADKDRQEKDQCSKCSATHATHSHRGCTPEGGCKHRTTTDVECDHAAACSHSGHRPCHHSSDHRLHHRNRHLMAMGLTSHRASCSQARYEACCDRIARQEQDWETTSTSTITSAMPTTRHHSRHHHRPR